MFLKGDLVRTTNHSNRIRGPVGKIKVEQDQIKLTAQVEELNRLLDRDQPVNSLHNRAPDQEHAL